MRKFKFFSLGESDAEIKSAEAAINPLLTAANITTIEVAGKPVPATSEGVPLGLKIAAFAATVKAGAADEDLSNALASNQILADQAKQFEARAVTAETSAGTLLREKTQLETDLSVSRASVQTLTAANAEQTNLRGAANAEAGRALGQLNALNSELSRRCLAVNCLTDLRDGDNNILPSNASTADKQAAADRIKPEDKLAALCGAVNSAIANVGVRTETVPSNGGGATKTETKKLSIDERCRLAKANQGKK